ncbi:MAG: M14 family metallopeptidase [Ferruginibacter sp.]
MKKFILFACFFYVTTLQAQNLKSPLQFLGYELGNKFTPHHKITRYFEQAAAAMPQMMKLQEYGQTYEGRPLLLAVITSPENISRLEDIRKNNIRMSGQLNDKPGDVNSPTIVWLSYNVHGNESSSSEVSMKTLYELLAPANPQTNQWLKNTIVIIDPCLNPDGRDRYVNWYNQVAGKLPNPQEDAREHNEPWPGGRSNHYNFDLNRDWAWQSQVETQQRIKVYNQWMPAIHVDFHEQSPGSPYYFAPAAEPFHEVITPFQRSFQSTIGKNHAKYFDAKGWLYFTKEYFDLFYPAYGDTYPIYNGSIGMTYEQAGSGMAGLTIAMDDDTLTLKDRIEHHFTTSMSTIEIASANAVKLNTEFKKYFEDGKNNGNGIYKTYIVSGASSNKLNALTELFDRNNITYGVAGKKVNVKGFNYFNGKVENYTTKENDLVISSFQPKAAFLKVLFEPQSKLSDSATYDITAWALPYAYGLQTYGVEDKISFSAPVKQTFTPVSTSSNTYGYLVDYNSLNDGKMLASLLKQGFKLRFAEKDFTYGGNVFKKGTIVILKNGNEDKIALLNEMSGRFASKVVPVLSGFMENGFDFGSDKLHLLKKPKVAMLTGNRVSSTGAGEVWHLFEQQLEYPITLVNADNIGNVNWKELDVLIIPDGNYRFLTEKDGNVELKSWVRQGGKIIAIENAVAQMAAGEWGIKLKKEEEEKPDDKKPSYADIKKYENRERDGIVNNIPGAIYKVELDNSHPLAFGYPATYFTLKMDGNIYEFLKNGWNVGVIKKENQVSGFVGSKIREKIKDGTVIAVQQMGRGSIVYFADNPLFRSFWENGKLLLTNAVFLAGQ